MGIKKVVVIMPNNNKNPRLEDTMSTLILNVKGGNENKVQENLKTLYDLGPPKLTTFKVMSKTV